MSSAILDLGRHPSAVQLGADREHRGVSVYWNIAINPLSGSLSRTLSLAWLASLHVFLPELQRWRQHISERLP